MMNERVFDMRLTGRYSGAENDVAELRVELLEDGVWKTFNLENETAGFLVFVYSVFTCQHMHLRLGCTAHGVLLEQATGSIQLATTDDWHLVRIHVNFQCRSSAGHSASEHIQDITRRMINCPVSRNLRTGIDCQTVIAIDAR